MGISVVSVRAVLVFALLRGPMGVAGDGLLEKVQAAYLLNFSRYAAWPEAAFSDALAPLAICVFGKDPLGLVLDRTLGARQSQGRPLVARRIAAIKDLRACHVLFIPRAEAGRSTEVLAAVASASVLTVGEQDDFLDQGGVLRFALVEGRLRFEANRSAAAHAGLRLSASLLGLALSVRGHE